MSIKTDLKILCITSKAHLDPASRFALDLLTFRESAGHLCSSVMSYTKAENSLDLPIVGLHYFCFNLKAKISRLSLYYKFPALPVSWTASGSLPICHVVEGELQQKVNLNCCYCARTPPGLYLIIQTRPISLPQLYKYGK